MLLLSVAVGIQWALAQSRQGPAQLPPRLSSGLMLALLLPALLSYAVWFGPLLGKPQLLLEIVRGERSELRDAISTVPGVTTFTQFGVAYAIAYAMKAGAGAAGRARLGACRLRCCSSAWPPSAPSPGPSGWR